MMDEMDEVWALYADDGSQALDAAETALDALGKGAEPADHVGALFRAVHTFKGNSRVLGLVNVESLAHLAEDLIGLVRDDGVALTGEITALLLRATDAMRVMLEETAENRTDVETGPTEPLKAELRALIAQLTGGDVDAEAPSQSAEAEVETPPAPVMQEEDRGTETAPDPETAPPAPEPEVPTAETESATPAQAKAAPAMDPALAGLLDQLDGSSETDFDPFEGDEDGEEIEEAAPEIAPAPEAPPDPTPTANATLAEVADGKPMGGLIEIDPIYREIFSDMALKTLGALDDAGDEATLAHAQKEVERLAYAAAQMGLDTWVAMLEPFPAQATQDDAATLADGLRDLLRRDFDVGGPDSDPAPDMPEPSAPPAPEPITHDIMPTPELPEPAEQSEPVVSEAPDDGSSFFAAMSEIYPVLADLGLRMTGDTPPALGGA